MTTKLSKSDKFYKTALNHFRQQYKDVVELTSLKITADNKICGGEWINSEGINCIAYNIDSVRSIAIVE